MMMDHDKRFELEQRLGAKLEEQAVRSDESWALEILRRDGEGLIPVTGCRTVRRQRSGG